MATPEELKGKQKNEPANIQDYQIETHHLRNGAVTSGKILDGTIVAADLDPAFLAGLSSGGGAPGAAIFLVAEGEEGPMGQPIPGDPGAAGAPGVGSPGPPGPAIFLVADAEDGDPGAPGPPGVGTAGAPGSPGSPGPAGPAIFLEGEGEEGPWGMPIPGTPGAPGAPGAPGTSGATILVNQEEPDDAYSMVPGPPGPAGLTTAIATRAIWLMADDMHADDGLVTVAPFNENGTTPNRYGFFSLADAVTSGVVFRVPVPPDWAGGVFTMHPYYVVSLAPGGADKVNWNYTYANVADNDVMTVAGTTVTTSQDTNDGTYSAGDLYVATVARTIGTPAKAGDVIRVQLERDGAGDLYAGVVRLVGVRIDYTAYVSAPATIPWTDFTKDLGASQGGHFDIAGLSGLTAGKNVAVMQTAQPIASKGNARDEGEFDPIKVTGYCVDASTIRCYWSASNPVVGTYAFAYAIAS